MNASFRHSSWLITLSLAAMAILYLSLVWIPNRKAIQELKEEIQTKHTFVAQSAGLAAAILGEEHELGAAETAVRQWKKSAPRHHDMPALYAKMDALAKDAHLTITRFDPQPPIADETVQQIPINIVCSGSFANIHEFLRGVERLPATIWVESLRLEKKLVTTKAVSAEIVLVVFSDNLQISDYVKHDK